MKTSKLDIQGLDFIMENPFELLQRLSNVCATPGDENEVRKIVQETIQSLVDELRIDSLGNLIAFKKGRGVSRRRVMVSAHMDEVGFMITAVDERGFYRFKSLGNIDNRQVPGKAVRFNRPDVLGIIGLRPYQLTLFSPEEREKPIVIDKLRIDCGLNHHHGVEIKPGDRAVFATNFQKIGSSVVGKALDNRLGVAILIELLHHSFDQIDLYAVFTTQGELGGRGAQVAAYAINPELAFTIDVIPANDFPCEGGTNIKYISRLDAGPVLVIKDQNAIYSSSLALFIKNLAKKKNLSLQVTQSNKYFSEAGTIQLAREGVRVITIAIPCRHPQTANSLVRIQDWKNTCRLFLEALSNIDKEVC